jgi:GNAT superfamily N-acetyltransferase
MQQPRSRVADGTDLDRLTAVLTSAFESDPLWSWALPDPDDLAALWRFFIRSALRYPCTWIAGDYAAIAMWIPPGGTELTKEEEQQLEPLLAGLIGPRAPAVMETFERFDASHPRERPHYYLSLLATDPDQRGRGVGMGLLAENVARMDEEGVPTYLESSNPANNPRYERLGYGQVGEFTTPGDERTVATMWREVGGPA